MAGLAQGFAQGFQMMDGYYNRQDNQAYRQEQLGLQQQQLAMQQERMDLARSANERAEQNHAMGLQGQAITNQWNAKRVNNFDNTVNQQNEIHGLQVDGLKMGNDAAKTQASNAASDRKRAEAMERYKVYATTGQWDKFIQDPSFEGTDLQLMQNPEGAEAAIALTKGIEAGDINTVVNESNRLFKSKLNRNVGKMEGRDGGIIRDITIVDFAQQPDGSVKVPVRVTTDKGTYNSYVSEMRGIDPNDPDKVFTADDLYGKAAAMGQLGAVLKSSGVYQKMQQNAQNYLTPKGGKGSGVPAKIQEMEYTRRLLGDEQYKQWLMYGRGKSPQELSMAAYKLASDTLDGVYFDTPEEKKAAVDKMTTELVSKFSQPTQNGTPQPNPEPNPNQHAQLLRQAAEAIQNGKDRNAVIQLLVEMGVPQDQINF